MTEYRGEVWQDGMKVAVAQCGSRKRVKAETTHYGMMYAQDGAVVVKFYKKNANNRWQRMPA